MASIAGWCRRSAGDVGVRARRPARPPAGRGRPRPRRHRDQAHRLLQIPGHPHPRRGHGQRGAHPLGELPQRLGLRQGAEPADPEALGRARPARAAPAGRARIGPVTRTPSAAASASETPGSATSALVCAVYRASPLVIIRCTIRPLKVSAATECTGLSSSGWWVTSSSAPQASASSTTRSSGSIGEQHPGHLGRRIAAGQAHRVPGLGPGGAVVGRQGGDDLADGAHAENLSL